MKIIKPQMWSSTAQLEVLQPSKAKLCISTCTGHEIIVKSEISHLTADSNYTSIFYRDKKLFCAQSLGVLADKLDSSNFIRIHKSYVVNIDKIRHIDAAFSTITTDDGHQLSVARSRKQEVKNIILSRFD